MHIFIPAAAIIFVSVCWFIGEISRQPRYGKQKPLKLRWFDHLYAWMMG
jgi:hypothetical protein